MQEYNPGTYQFPRWLFRDARRAQRAQKFVFRLGMPIYRRYPKLGVTIIRFAHGFIARQEFRLYRP